MSQLVFDCSTSGRIEFGCAGKEIYEEIEIFDTPALFSAGRIQKDSLPEGFYCYEVPHDDECIGIPCELSSHILVNFWRTVISRVPLIKEKECRRYIEDEDWGYTGNAEIQLESWIEA
ncbi:LPD28 domain-containing protein [Mediterraneibacter gnavus]|uniref:LPD28 domain-containing protein n=1 Tax=Mediterraneibacter gnavus TaxID=33038 RepID=UPI0015F8C5C1